MKRPLRYIRQHLSLRLGLIITLIIAVAFLFAFCGVCAMLEMSRPNERARRI